MRSPQSSSADYPPDILAWLLLKFSGWLLPKPENNSPFVWRPSLEWRGFSALLKSENHPAAKLEFRIAWPPQGKSFATCGDVGVNYEVAGDLDDRWRAVLESEAQHIIRKLSVLQERLPLITAELFPGLADGLVRWSESPLPVGLSQESGDEKDVMIKLNDLACGLQCAFCTRSRHPDHVSLPGLHLIDQLYRAALSLGRPGPATDFLRIGVDEPTRHPYLTSFIALGAHLGYRRISLQTVATGLKSPQDATALVRAGLSDVQMPLYGLSAEIHDRVVNCTGHFKHITAMMDAFLQAGARVTLHSVPTIINHADISALPRWCESKGIEFHGFFFPRQEGPSRLPIGDIMPRLSDLHPEVRTRLDLFIPCLNIGTKDSPVDGRGGVKEVVSESGNASKASFDCFFASTCNSCTKRSLCTGVYKGYLELYGENEFVPIKQS